MGGGSVINGTNAKTPATKDGVFDCSEQLRQAGKPVQLRARWQRAQVVSIRVPLVKKFLLGVALSEFTVS